MGHDLMSPHVMLHNEPSISALNGEISRGIFKKDSLHSSGFSAEEEFLSYISQLLDNSRRDSSLGLLSPSAAGVISPLDVKQESTTMDGVISIVIQQSNSVMPAKISANRFEITRGGLQVAAIMLARPAYRLGETIPVAIDFHASDYQCLSLRVTLETSEHIDPTIALRSPASILRASRKIYATQHEMTISTKRLFFNLAIPSSSTPEFITSGVGLEWRLRLEFVTGNHLDRETLANEVIHHVLEQVAEDERGTVSIAVEAMPCETFEVTLPLHIYGGVSEIGDKSVRGPRWFDIG
ncbi:MAG: hypothetical protein Q9209_007833 [Squamulea sp. 1 TL-2023]